MPFALVAGLDAGSIAAIAGTAAAVALAFLNVAFNECHRNDGTGYKDRC